MKITYLVSALFFASSLLATGPVMAKGKVYIPIPSYRVGPYAAGGTGYFGGVIDYMTLMNSQGGVNGVKLTWSECETEYTVERGVECYRRMKNKGGGAIFFDPLSAGISSALIETTRRDKIPLIFLNHGKAEAQQGNVFPYSFATGLNTYDQHSIVTKFLAHLVTGDPSTEADRHALKGKTIVTLYHGSPYGRTGLDYLDMLGEKYGFKQERIEVPHPGNEQQSQWLRIRRLKPDFVFMRGWGVMNPVAMQTAVRTGYPVKKLIGNIWSNSEEDVIPAGDAADGYQAIITQPSGTKSDILQEIKAKVYGKGKGDLNDKSRIGSVYHNLGVMAGIMDIEAMRVAQARWGDKPVNAKQMRWGFENLKLTKARLDELGANDLMPPIVTTCADHTGGHKAKFEKWDADNQTFTTVTPDWIEGDPKLVDAVTERKAQQYKKENNIKDRNCSNASDRDDWDLPKALKVKVPEGLSTWNYTHQQSS